MECGFCEALVAKLDEFGFCEDCRKAFSILTDKEITDIQEKTLFKRQSPDREFGQAINERD